MNWWKLTKIVWRNKIGGNGFCQFPPIHQTKHIFRIGAIRELVNCGEVQYKEASFFTEFWIGSMIKHPTKYNFKNPKKLDFCWFLIGFFSLIQSNKNPTTIQSFWIFGVGFGRMFNHSSNRKSRKKLTCCWISLTKSSSFFLDFGFIISFYYFASMKTFLKCVEFFIPYKPLANLFLFPRFWL
jgi:hypothetical protein